jgi:hypothetical protein
MMLSDKELSTKNEIRTSVRSLMTHGGFPEEIVKNLLDPSSALTPEEITELERFEVTKFLREQIPSIRKTLLEYITKRRAYQEELFVLLVSQGVSIRNAKIRTGIELTEEQLKALEETNPKILAYM